MGAIFTTEGIGAELRQGEIISGLQQYAYDQATSDIILTTHNYVVVASQECDLLRDFESRAVAGEDSPLNGILLFEAESHSIVKSTLARTNTGGRDIWKRIIQNGDDRYHYLEGATGDLDAEHAGFPGLIVDFRRYFSVHPGWIYSQVSAEGPATRRCRLSTPYREHFQSRAAFYLQRVSLDPPHAKPADAPPIS